MPAGRARGRRPAGLGGSKTMNPFFGKAGAWLLRRAENFAAGLLAAMFVAFMVQIVFRYLFNFPVGWTSELSVITWLWLVLWGAAFVVKESEEIRFDLLYSAAGRRTRRVMGIVALTLLGLPIGHAMIGGSVLYLFLAGLDMGTAAEQLLNGMYSSFVLLAIPLFILAAEFMTIGSITERLLNFCNAFVGRFRGGLAHVNVVQSIIFAGMSGSALADAASSGKLMEKMMTQDGKYTASFAAALTAASSVIGPIIPPSIPMVIYALVSDTSVGYLFLGGVIPGLLLGIAQMAYVSLVAKRKNFPVEKAVPLRDIPRITWEAFPALMMPVVLFGCLYSGITTPTEAAALAAFYALLVSAFLSRAEGGERGGFSGRGDAAV